MRTAVQLLCLFLLSLRPAAAAPAFTVHVEGERGEDDAPAPDEPAAVTVVPLGRLGDLGAARTASLGALIDGEPGVRVRSAGLGQFSAALLRGAASSQVAIFLDGVPLSRGAAGALDLSQIPVDGLERVEIYRGVPPLSLGPDAVGGAINLVSRRAAGPGRTLSLSASSGSFGLRKAAASYGERRGGLRAAASLAYEGATGDFPYYYTSGFVYSLEGHGELRRQNDGFDQVSADVRLGYERGPLSLRAEAHGTLRQGGVAGAGQPAAQPGRPDLGLGRALLSLGATGRLLGGRLELSAGAHALLERSLYRDLVASPPSLFEALSAQAGGQLGARLRLRPEQVLLVLLDLRYERLRTDDLCPAPRGDCAAAAPTASERLRGDLAVGGDLSVDGGRLVLQPGLQLLFAQSNLLPLSGGYSMTTPGLAPGASSALFPAPRVLARLRLLDGLILRASAGRFLRLPTFLELFGDRAFFRANLSLRPESAWTVEGGLRAERELPAGLAASLELTAFSRLVDDLIDTVRDGAQLRARNVGAARVLGAEAELRLRLRDLVAARLVYGLLDARDLTPAREGKLLPGRPPHSVLLRLDGGHGPARLFYELDYAAALFLDPANLQPRPERTLHALGVTLGPLELGAVRAQLQVELRNLLDTRVVTVPGKLTQGGQPALTPLVDFFDYPLPGRALYATLSGHL